MDFFHIKEQVLKNGSIEIYPDFKVCRSKDLMVRGSPGSTFYAIWDEEKGLWSTDEYDVQRLVDKELWEHRQKMSPHIPVRIKLMSEFSTKSWSEFRSYMKHISDNSHQLDTKLTFQNTEVRKKDYVSRRLPYSLEPGGYEAFDEIIGTLYDVDERTKLEWAIGAIVSGDSKDIQKFLVLYGEPGAGKSTILNIIQKLFEGYYTTFDAHALTSSNNGFATEVFRNNPLVAIQHDGDLSKIEDNTKLNSIVSHEEMTMNEKYKSSYTSRLNCFLLLATNKPVRISDGKSGIIRRLIDVRPSGRKLPPKRYHALMSQTDFELGAIAYHCLEVYRDLGKNYYASYRPLEMILQTDVFFNFIEQNYFTFKEQDGTSLSQAYEMYKHYCDETLVEHKIPRHKFREELKNYFTEFSEVGRVNGQQVRSYYSGFQANKFTSLSKPKEEHATNLVLDCGVSLLDTLLADCPAQYVNVSGTPVSKWEKVETKLSDINTTEIHYVKVPENHIVIDFDLTAEKGKKSMERNLEAASKWPSTYAEFSKSGAGIHLHYIYDGDVSRLKREYEPGIEIKVFTGNSALRRKLSFCNNVPVAVINSGLPLKEEVMINFEAVKSEKGLRELIKRNLKKEIHPGTKPSMDFIFKILEDAYNSGVKYDLTDMRPAIMAFANNSTNQPEYCLKLIPQMKFKSEEASSPEQSKADKYTFFDVEVFPNLFVVVWKNEGGQKVKMINPTPEECGALLSFMLIGFNCRRYDNHIIYARYIGYSLEQLFNLSQRIINGSPNCMFAEAYNISYTDIYDFSSEKKSLKKFEIELGIHHQELGLPWDQPVPEDRWEEVADYCGNDVDATEATFHARKQDFVARLILSKLSGLTPNDTTQQHASKIIFGLDPKPQDQFVYTDLSTIFPGYKYENGKSSYRGEDPGEGGYVYAEPGMYADVALLDVASMHPNSLIQLEAFGPYTRNFEQLVDARLAIKHGDIEKAKSALGGILVPYLDNPEERDDLAYSLKIVINIVYGLTSASFKNKFKDPRNVDNIVAKRGALFMIDLKNAVQEKGFTVAHVKTDSIKIPGATPEIIDFVMEFGRKYGYTFEHEATYDRMCLVNDAVYIARYGWAAKTKLIGQWTATGAQFAQPYVFKKLFSKEPIEFKDMCETKAVTTSIFLDFNENLGPDEHNYRFVGKVGSFCPVKPGVGGGVLYREKDGKYYAVGGTKGYRWLEEEVVRMLGKESDINVSYYDKLVDEAFEDIRKFGDIEWFIDDAEVTKAYGLPF